MPISGLPVEYWVTLLVFSVLAVFFYCAGLGCQSRLRGWKRASGVWFRPRNLVPYADSWPLQACAAALITSLAITLSHAVIMALILCQLGPPQSGFLTQLTTFPGVFFTGAMGFVSVLSVLNTICILRRQSLEVRSFAELAQSFDAVLREKPFGTLGDSQPISYLVDYLPLIGALSDPASSKQIIDRLHDWRLRNDAGLVHLVFQPPRALVPALQPSGRPNRLIETTESTIERMLLHSTLPEDQIAPQLREITKKVLEEYEELDADRFAVWFSESIGTDHYLVTDQAAVAYFVVPDDERSGSTNLVRGSVFSELTHIRYLREVAESYLKRAITPGLVSAVARGDGDLDLEIEFLTGQQKIQKVQWRFYDDARRVLSDPYNWDVEGEAVSPGARFRAVAPTGTGWLRVCLYKGTRNRREVWSPLSNFVRLTHRSL